MQGRKVRGQKNAQKKRERKVKKTEKKKHILPSPGLPDMGWSVTKHNGAAGKLEADRIFSKIGLIYWKPCQVIGALLVQNKIMTT